MAQIWIDRHLNQCIGHSPCCMLRMLLSIYLTLPCLPAFCRLNYMQDSSPAGYGHPLGRPRALGSTYFCPAQDLMLECQCRSLVLLRDILDQTSVSLCIATKMLELPDELLCMIAWQVLKIEDGLRMWCRLSTTCKRLWSVQLPSEPLHFLYSNRTAHGDVSCLSCFP